MEAPRAAAVFLAIAVLTSAVQDARAGSYSQKFVVDGGVKSSLFHECITLANTVEGEIFSIPFNRGVEYQRFAPKKLLAVDWMRLNGASDILACADAAYAKSALMFKFDGACYASGKTAYDVNNDEQDSGDAPAEVVYVRTPLVGGLLYNNTFVPDGQPITADGCLLSNSSGIVMNDNFKTPYNASLMPAKLTCCKGKIAGHCVDFYERSYKFAYCEAVLGCQALGLELASYELYNYTEIQQFIKTLLAPPASLWSWINVKRGDDGVFRFVPGGQENKFPFKPYTTMAYNCTEYQSNYAYLFTSDCGAKYESRAICIGPNSALPKCLILE
ncbi:uncharacterized protein LOC108667297 [Hyalella azteca]|uniref:Uncharacterized protein LOC108667297 n=1 Tax=Hyalella azteca TaxID=294128 RepID=A0A8B7N980_HYAAZ|nr:uncharacterized protein LOC108667297 [Hyalella azteca]